MPDPIKLLLVEDDELFRLGLKVRLQQESGFEVVAEAVDGETAVEITKQQPLSAVILDVGLPGIGGIEACAQIKQQNAHLPVLILTSYSQEALIGKLIEAGAQGYCLKGVAAETLMLAIRSIVAGASWWDANATAEIRSSMGNSIKGEAWAKAIPALASSLTQREQEILALVARGKTNQEIATNLYITAGTVRVHVHAILSKLNVRDRTQAVQLAMQKKLIDPALLSSS